MLAIDSSKVSVDKEEFKHIIKVNIEKNILDSTSNDQKKIIETLKEQVENREDKLKSKDEEIKQRTALCEAEKDELRLPWWNRWYVGAIVMAIIAAIL